MLPSFSVVHTVSTILFLFLQCEVAFNGTVCLSPAYSKAVVQGSGTRDAPRVSERRAAQAG